jgi:excisionase family DNA binding protein
MDGTRREVLTVNEVATLLGLAPDTVYREAAAGSIPTVRIAKLRRVMFSREQIERLLRGAEEIERRELAAA